MTYDMAEDEAALSLRIQLAEANRSIDADVRPPDDGPLVQAATTLIDRIMKGGNCDDAFLAYDRAFLNFQQEAVQRWIELSKEMS